MQHNAFAYDKWSVSHFLPVTSPKKIKNCFTSTTPQACSYTTLWLVVDHDACFRFSLVFRYWCFTR